MKFHELKMEKPKNTARNFFAHGVAFYATVASLATAMVAVTAIKRAG
jgi:hypothetical protein